MLARTDENIQSILRELRTHPSLSAFSCSAPAIHEFSPQALHFSARETATGQAIILKVGVTQGELYWTSRLAGVAPDLFPRVLATGHLAGDVGFFAQERLPHTLIGPEWRGRQVDLMLDAAALFQKAVRSIDPQHVKPLSLGEVLRWLTEGGEKDPPGDWRRVHDCAEQDYAWLAQACPFEICHGDLHVGNAFSRHAPPQGPALLIDLNPILQLWVLDAAWVEVCAWPDQPRRGAGHAVRYLADRRREAGLEVPDMETLEKAGRIALSWLAVRLWDPDHLEFMPGFDRASQTHIDRGASLSR